MKSIKAFGYQRNVWLNVHTSLSKFANISEQVTSLFLERVRQLEAKYGGSHFWLCGGQGGVLDRICVPATLPCPQEKRPL